MGVEGLQPDPGWEPDASWHKLVAEFAAQRYALATLFIELAQQDRIAAARATKRLCTYATGPLPPRVATEIEALAEEWMRLLPGAPTE